MIDVDYFKCYNDCYGYQVGDECLFFVVQVFKMVVWVEGDLVVCYGGEEFVVVLFGVFLVYVIVIVECIQQKICEVGLLYVVLVVVLEVIVSIGIVVFDGMVLIEMLIVWVDRVLYQVKNKGCN